MIHLLYAWYRVGFPSVPEVTVATLQGWLDAGDDVVLVDVRTAEEQAVSMLPGAIRAVDVDPEELRGRVLVAYCTIGARSGEWALVQREAGLDVRNLAGGVLAWTHSGRALQGPDGPTRRVHVYGRRWSLARSDYEAVW